MKIVYQKWNTLDAKQKKERVSLIIILVALFLFPYIWDYGLKKINLPLQQQGSIMEDIKATINPVLDLPQDMINIQKEISIKEEDAEKTPHESDSIDTEVENVKIENKVINN